MSGFTDKDRGIGERPAGEAAQRAFDLAQRAIDAFHAGRRVSRELG
jgi:hypothetical protein